MIRIVCPHCHAPLSTAELEQATIDGHLYLLCPECAAVLVSEAEQRGSHHTLEAPYPDESFAHA